MLRYCAPLALAMAACSSAATQPPPSLSPARTDARELDPVPPQIEALAPTKVEAPAVPVEGTTLYSGQLVQAGLSFWRTAPGSGVFLDGKTVSVDRDGYFALGFGRDHQGGAELLIVYPSGREEQRTLSVGDRDFPISRIDGVPQRTVTPYSQEQLDQIAEEREIKRAARSNPTATSYWRAGWQWPAKGRISSRMGSARFYNGSNSEGSPHSGTDIAAAPGTSPLDFQGTDVRAPSTGKVTLARPDMYFEGGLILIDHGQNLESAILHLSRVDVRPGQVVTKGEVIGAVGMTGRATGPHVHWTVNWQGTPVDPQLLVPPMDASGD